ncbi:NRDE-2, necessary for RNA interference-domain-containing protein [Dipodascopsis uninucleata]
MSGDEEVNRPVPKFTSFKPNRLRNSTSTDIPTSNRDKEPRTSRSTELNREGSAKTGKSENRQKFPYYNDRSDSHGANSRSHRHYREYDSYLKSRSSSSKHRNDVLDRHGSNKLTGRSRYRSGHDGDPPDIDEQGQMESQPSSTSAVVKGDSLFEINSKGDKDNLTYKRPYKYAIPQYYRITNRVLGLSKALKIEETDLGLSLITADEIDNDKNTRQSWVLKTHPKRIRLDVYPESPTFHSREFISLENRENKDTTKSLSFSLFDDTDSEKDSQQPEIDSELDVLRNKHARVTRLRKEAQEYPNDAQKWIDLAECLDEINRHDTSLKSRNEIILSVYKKALHYLPNHTDLTVRYMSAYEISHGKYQASKKWDSILRLNPDRPEFWIKWMEFCIRDGSDFKFNDVLVKIKDALKRVYAVLHDSSDLELEFINLLARIYRFLYEAGYTELSIAIIQGLLHLNVFRPVNVADKDALNWLETFWNDEITRVGETGEPHSYQADDEYSSWIDNEVAQCQYIVPGKLEVEYDDPYRIVVFADICDFMYVLKSKSCKKELIWSCLRALGCQTPGSNRFDFLNQWPSKLSLDDNADSLSAIIEYQFCDTLISQLLEFIDDEDLQAWCLHYSYLRNASNSEKISKKLLEHHSSRIMLWRQYMVIEWDLGNRDRCRKIFKNANRLLSGEDELLLLWEKWIELLFFKSDEPVLSILAGFPDAQPLNEITSRNILICRNALNTYIHKFIASDKFSLIVSAVKCLTILEYLVSDKSLDRSCEIVEEYINEFKSRDLTQIRECKDLCFFLIELIKYHMNHSRIYKVSLFRKYLETFIKVYPTDVEFLRIYMTSERRFRIENNVNNILNDYVLVKSNPTLYTWYYAICYQVEVNANNVARSYFERAINNENTRSNPSLWKAYVEFELSHQQKWNAKKILYRAIAACPWSKDLIMFGFTSLRDIMSASEMRQLSEIMLERELRIRVVIPENEFGLTDVLQYTMHGIPEDSSSEE